MDIAKFILDDGTTKAVTKAMYGDNTDIFETYTKIDDNEDLVLTVVSK